MLAAKIREHKTLRADIGNRPQRLTVVAHARYGAGRIDAEVTDTGIVHQEIARIAVGQEGCARINEAGDADETIVARFQKA